MSTLRLAVTTSFAIAACHSPAPPPPVAPVAAHQHHAGGHTHDWNAVYADGSGFEHAPSKVLVDAIAGVSPGTALDLGMGQGRNAVFLATKGWTVTGVDTSTEGVKQGTDNATRAGVSIDGRVADVETFDMGRDRWQLVALVYMGADHALLERIKTALAPGGRVVIEFFHEDSNNYFEHPIRGIATGELARVFDGFDIVRDDVVEDVAEWGKRPAKLVRFVARKR